MSRGRKALSAPLTNNEIVQGWVYFLLEMTVLPPILASFVDAFGVSDRVLWINFLYYLVNFLACLLIFRRFLGKNLALAGENPVRFLVPTLLGAVLAVGGNWLLGWVFQTSVPGFANLNDGAVQAMVVQNPLLMTLAVVVLVPPAEECIFRGLLFRALHDGSRVAAYAVSMACFCTVHILGYLNTAEPLILLLCFLQYVPAAFALCWAYERSDSIFCPILIHAAVNAVGILSWR